MDVKANFGEVISTLRDALSFRWEAVRYAKLNETSFVKTEEYINQIKLELEQIKDTRSKKAVRLANDIFDNMQNAVCVLIRNADSPRSDTSSLEAAYGLTLKLASLRAPNIFTKKAKEGSLKGTSNLFADVRLCAEAFTVLKKIYRVRELIHMEAYRACVIKTETDIEDRLSRCDKEIKEIGRAHV